jgi:hypothetical protein
MSDEGDLMPEERYKASDGRSALLRCVIAIGLVLFGAPAVIAQSTSTSNANGPASEPAGKLIIAPQFDEAWPFSEGLAKVKQNGKWGFIDKTGTLVITPSSEEAESFSEERAEIRQNGKWGFIDKAGKAIVAPQFQEVRRFTEGLAAVKSEGKWGFVDKAGTMVISPAFTSARSFTEGLAAVTGTWGLGATKWSFIDPTGKVAIDSIGGERIDYATEFSEGLAIACHGTSCRFIDKTGKVVIAGPFAMRNTRLWGFREGLAACAKNFRHGFLDTNGTLVIPQSFYRGQSEDYDVVGGTSVFRDADRVLDKTRMAIELPALLRTYAFSEGLAAVAQQQGKWGFIDKTGTMTISARFDIAFNFSDGLALVAISRFREYGYIDKTGTMVIGPYVFEKKLHIAELKDFSEGMAPVVISGKWGYAGRDR